MKKKAALIKDTANEVGKAAKANGGAVKTPQMSPPMNAAKGVAAKAAAKPAPKPAPMKEVKKGVLKEAKPMKVAAKAKGKVKM